MKECGKLKVEFLKTEGKRRVVCQWCTAEMSITNVYKHLTVCQFKKKGIYLADCDIVPRGGAEPKLEVKKVEKIIVDDEKDQKIELLTSRLQHLEHAMEGMMKIFGEARIRTEKENLLTSKEIIAKFYKNTRTRKTNTREWEMFKKFLDRENKSRAENDLDPISAGVKAADNYIQGLIDRADYPDYDSEDETKPNALSTIERKRNQLQSLIRKMIDSNARLMKVGVYHIKKKYPMKNEELSAYMAEQKTWRTSEDYFIQFLMALYGLRVNAVSGLRIKHLDFQNKLITFPDTKCRMRLPEKPMQGSVEAMLMQQIGAGPYDKERFVFKTIWTDDIYKRAHDLGTLVTSFIRQSQVFQFQTEKYVYSSHCFRKTLAYEDHLKTEKESLEKISLILDHVGKTAVGSYVG